MPQEKLVPYVAAGVGGTNAEYPINFDNDNDFLFNYGAGVKYFLSDNWALRADIRHLLVFDGGRQDWESTIGLTFFFGGMKPAPVAAMDSDNDGVLDSMDKCPDTPKGVSVDAAGCPLDSDGDGVVDSLDKCPNTPKGEKVGADGCPLVSDSDGDGVVDSLDKCPNTPKGEMVGADGCSLDSDGDGVVDSLDKCPNTPKGAKVDKDGCPEKLAEKVSIALQIEFDSGKADIKSKYEEQIKKVADFMTTYPETTAVIEGHTDNVGKEASNLRLSTRRAESVRTYLIEKFSIAPERLITKGFGSSQPVADNATPDGRQKNRRITAVIETMTVR
jgi:OOP family OmpA-OmpF porin